MAKRKRKARRHRVSSAALMSASPRRRKRYSLSTTPKRRKRRRGMSELALVKGKAGTYLNPIIEGTIGGVATQVLVKAVPEKMFTDNPNLQKSENWIKGGILLLGAVAAAHLKQPLMAAGMAGAATILTMQKEGILQDEGYHGGFSAGGFRRGNFADDRLLSDSRLLSENIYADYDPLYDSPADEFRLGRRRY